MNVHWTQTAQGRLDAIYRYIAQDSPKYATRMVDRITQRSQQIGDYPLSGRRVPEFDDDQVREVIEGSYRVIDRIQSSQIDVLAVIHGARELRKARESET